MSNSRVSFPHRLSAPMGVLLLLLLLLFATPQTACGTVWQAEWSFIFHETDEIRPAQLGGMPQPEVTAAFEPLIALGAQFPVLGPPHLIHRFPSRLET